MIADLTEALHGIGVESTVFATVGPRVGNAPVSLGGFASVRLFGTDRLSRMWVAHSSSLARAVGNEIEHYDLVHIHELWHHPLWSAYRTASRCGVPFVMTPHGQLDSWALSHKAWKKRIFSTLVQHRIVREAATIHALTAREAEQIRMYGVTRAPFVIPNAANIRSVRPAPDRFYALFPHLVGKQVVLFLGRIHLQKGLDVLVEAFEQVSRSVPNAQLAIVGPDENRLAEILKRRCRELGIERTVTFTGPLYEEDKQAALAAARLFVLPSRFEGQSMALLEAMAAGLPSVVTPAANSPDVAAAGAGMVVPLAPADLGMAIVKLLSDDSVAQEMGRNAQRAVQGEYSWARTASSMAAMYETAVSR